LNRGGYTLGERTEDGVDDMVGRPEGGGEVVDKGDVKIFELLGQALRRVHVRENNTPSPILKVDASIPKVRLGHWQTTRNKGKKWPRHT